MHKSRPSPFRFLYENVHRSVGQYYEILEKSRIVASNNLILLDAEGCAAVAEMGPERFEVRTSEDGALFATNHHRKGKGRLFGCWRYDKLSDFCKENKGRIDVPSLERILHEVNQDIISIQSMVFEPSALKLHLSMGRIPATQGPFKTIRLEEALKGASPKEDA